MSRSDGGSKIIAVGLEPENLRERARFYADRNQIESAVFFAGNWNVMHSSYSSFLHTCRAPGCIFEFRHL
jgi:hypothetical protein